MAGKLLLATMLVSVTTSAFAAEAWQAQWDATLAAARKEGVVTVSGPPGAAQRQAVATIWAKDFPGIRLDYTGARGTQMISKVVRERASGLFNWDIIIASTDPTVFSLVPIDALAPLRDALIMPDIADDKTWMDSFDAGFMDRQRKFLYNARGTGAQQVGYVNRACVSTAVMSSAADLGKPELKGKIAWFDPTRPSSASRSTWVLSVAQGKDWLKDMLVNHDVTFSRDFRQMADWLVHCDKWVAVGMTPDVIGQMQEQGIGDKVEEMAGKAYSGDHQPGGAGGNESIGWYNNAPHPNAAKIFVNWYLSRDFQEYYARAVVNNSRRVDTKPGDPNHVMQPGISYMSWSNEEATLEIKALQAEVKKWGVMK